MHGWAQTTVYDRGIHIVGLEAEGDTGVRLSLDAEVGVNPLKSDSFLPAGYALDPVVTDAHIQFEDFRLTRISDLRGTLAKEIGVVLREVLAHALHHDLGDLRPTGAVEIRDGVAALVGVPAHHRWKVRADFVGVGYRRGFPDARSGGGAHEICAPAHFSIT